MKRSDFFGMDWSQHSFQLDSQLKSVGLYEMVNAAESVVNLREKYGLEHGIVRIARRQATIKLLRPLLNSEFSDYDAYFYVKEVNTATLEDRRYDAEENILKFALTVATATNCKRLEEDHFVPNIRALRNCYDRKRFGRFWDILSDDTSDYVERFRAQHPEGIPTRKAKKKSFLGALFG